MSIVETQSSASPSRQPAVAATGPLSWPKKLAQQMQVIRAVVQQSDSPLSTAQVALRFGRIKPATVQPLLDTLTALALLRQTDAGAYAA